MPNERRTFGAKILPHYTDIVFLRVGVF